MAYSSDLLKMAIMDYQGWLRTILDYQGLSWIVMDCQGLSTFLDNFHGWLPRMTAHDCHGWLSWLTVMEDFHGWLSYCLVMDGWTDRQTLVLVKSLATEKIWNLMTKN